METGEVGGGNQMNTITHNPALEAGERRKKLVSTAKNQISFCTCVPDGADGEPLKLSLERCHVL